MAESEWDDPVPIVSASDSPFDICDDDVKELTGFKTSQIIEFAAVLKLPPTQVAVALQVAHMVPTWKQGAILARTWGFRLKKTALRDKVMEVCKVALSVLPNVVDVTKVVTVVHQNHDYIHVPSRTGQAWAGPETDSNLKLMGGQDHRFTLLDATHLMTARALLPALGYKYLRRRWQTLPILAPRTRPVFRLLQMIRRHFRTVPSSVGSE